MSAADYPFTRKLLQLVHVAGDSCGIPAARYQGSGPILLKYAYSAYSPVLGQCPILIKYAYSAYSPVLGQCSILIKYAYSAYSPVLGQCSILL